MSAYLTNQIGPALPERPAHVRVLITGTLFCDRCHSSTTAAQLREHRHLPERPDGAVPLPFGEVDE